MTCKLPRKYARRPSPALRAMVATALVACAGLSGCGSTPERDDPGRDDEFSISQDRPPTPRTLIAMARLLAGKGEYSSAEHVYGQAIAAAPNEPSAALELADLQRRRGRPDAALATLRRAVTDNPQDPGVAQALGLLLLQLRRSDEAADAFRIAASIAPDQPAHINGLAVALAMSGQQEAALAEFRRVMPEAEAFWNLAVASEAAGRYDAAAQAFAQAHAIDARLGAGTEAQRVERLASLVPSVR